jgi:hypothetical protein
MVKHGPKLFHERTTPLLIAEISLAYVRCQQEKMKSLCLVDCCIEINPHTSSLFI